MNTSIAVPHHPSLITWMATECLKGGVHWPMACHLLGQDGAGWHGKAQDFVILLRVACSLKLVNCLFLECSISCFWTAVDSG